MLKSYKVIIRIDQNEKIVNSKLRNCDVLYYLKVPLRVKNIAHLHTGTLYMSIYVI